MATVRQHLVFLTGHRISARTTVEEIGSLSKIGAAIAFASFLAALQFGIAGWFLAMGLHIAMQALMSLVFAAIGAAIVLVLDRNFIYLADTRYETMEKELMYSSDKLKNRATSLNDSILFCMADEAVKPAFLRKKVSQGRNTDSQKDVKK